MYRVRTTAKAKPLVIASELLDEYAVNNVDTLHKKNLLSLGEDRFLTTLLLKHFPDFRTKFTPDAHCETVVPDKMEVLLSQRRRWINSTIHNQSVYLLLSIFFCQHWLTFI
jgi:chitin synthase